MKGVCATSSTYAIPYQQRFTIVSHTSLHKKKKEMKNNINNTSMSSGTAPRQTHTRKPRTYRQCHDTT
eukprot:m.19621 g.19621  ORF g.19621 m.19621 type:complete len:68 (+) comp5140_c1_seq1:147-350(+)